MGWVGHYEKGSLVSRGDIVRRGKEYGRVLWLVVVQYPGNVRKERALVAFRKFNRRESYDQYNDTDKLVKVSRWRWRSAIVWKVRVKR